MWGLLKWGLLAWTASRLFAASKADVVPPGGKVVPPGNTLDDVLMQAFAADWIAGSEDTDHDEKLFGEMAEAAAANKIPVRWLIAFAAMAASVDGARWHQLLVQKGRKAKIAQIAADMRDAVQTLSLPAVADPAALDAWRKQVVSAALGHWQVR